MDAETRHLVGVCNNLRACTLTEMQVAARKLRNAHGPVYARLHIREFLKLRTKYF